MSHAGQVKYTIPDTIRNAMHICGIKTPRQLATKARLAPMVVHRLFSTCNHRPLRTYTNMADALGWDMQKLFDVCLMNSGAASGKIISARLKALDMSLNEFGRRLGWVAAGGAGVYLSGKCDYAPMKTYDAICRVLGITPGAFCKAMLDAQSIDERKKSSTLNSCSEQKA